MVDSEDYVSSSSIGSGCSFSCTESCFSSDEERLNSAKPSDDRSLRKRPKRRRIHSHSGTGGTVPVVVTAVARSTDDSIRNNDAAPCKTAGSDDRTSPVQVAVSSNQPPFAPQELTSSRKPIGSPLNRAEEHSPQDSQEDGDGDDDDSETEVNLFATTSSLTPCFREVHASTWSRLFRIWDRTVSVQAPTDPERTLFNTGSCSRTDLIYNGRSRCAEDLTNARRELYSRHQETAVGPGTSTLEEKVELLESSRSQPRPLDSNTSYSSSQHVPADSAVLNLSARTDPSPTSRTTGSSSRSFDTSFPTPSTQQPPNPVASLKNPSIYFPDSRASLTPHQTSACVVPPSSYDPSATQQQIQAAYEQAMFLAAAATQQHFQQAKQQSREIPQPNRPPHASSAVPPARTPITGLPSATKANAAHRLGAAAGTFYPPALVTSALNLASPNGGLSAPASHLPHQPFAPSFLHAGLLNSLSVGPNMAHSTGYPSFSSPAAPSSTTAGSGESLWKNHELIQRQLAMMGLLPPTNIPDLTNLYGSMDPREAEAFRMLMAEKLSQFRYPSANAQKHHDFLAAAGEALLRGRVNPTSVFCDNNSSSHPNSSSFPPGGGAGAMTSAVNSISTRPTASIQSPHYRHSSGSSAHASSHSRHPSQDSHPQHSLPGFHPSPPVAHLSMNSPSSRLSSLNLPSTSNFHQASTTPSRLTNPAAHIPSRSTSTTPQQLQEQMLHAAKFAMLAANMQSDPNKALSLAAAAFAEIAAQEKAQSASTLPHLLGQTPKPSGLGFPAYDMRAPGSSSSGAHHSERIEASSPFMSGDRRRPSVPSFGTLSPSLLSHSQVGSGTAAVKPPSHQSRIVPSPAASSSSNRLPSVAPNPAANLAAAFGSGHILSPSQLAHLTQFAHSAGLPPGLGMQDHNMLNALALAATAYAARYPPSDLPLSGDCTDRPRYPGQSTGSTSRHASLQHQQQQQQQAAAAAAAAAFAALPHFNLGPHRLPSSHR